MKKKKILGGKKTATGFAYVVTPSRTSLKKAKPKDKKK